MRLARRIASGAGEIEIVLSRRNLLALLHKLDGEGSECTIQKYQDGTVLTVVAEDNDAHYGDGEAGIMHDETERFIDKHSDDYWRKRIH